MCYRKSKKVRPCIVAHFQKHLNGWKKISKCTCTFNYSFLKSCMQLTFIPKPECKRGRQHLDMWLLFTSWTSLFECLCQSLCGLWTRDSWYGICTSFLTVSDQHFLPFFKISMRSLCIQYLTARVLFWVFPVSMDISDKGTSVSDFIGSCLLKSSVLYFTKVPVWQVHNVDHQTSTPFRHVYGSEKQN